MVRIAFVTTGQNWRSDVEQLGHSTFLAETATLADVTPLKAVLSAAFQAIADLQLDSYYAVVLSVAADSTSVTVTAGGKVPAGEAAATPDLSPEELDRNLRNQAEDRQALEGMLADAQAAGLV